MTEAQVIIEAKLDNDDYFLCTCLLILYMRQEDDEKASADSHHDNGIGFNKSDAPYLTDIATKLTNASMYSVLPLSAEEFIEVRKRMKKYANQLSRILPEEEYS